MSRKIRLILFFSFVFLYLLVSPILIVYSLGYRVDFENRRLVSTGGLYLKIWPQEAGVTIDEKTEKRTSFFSNQILIQGLFPKTHSILVQKDGYYPWQKALEIKDKEVIRVENITLIKREIIFSKVGATADQFSISPDNKNILLIKNSEGLAVFNLFDGQTKAEKNTFEIANPKISTFNIIWSGDSSRFLIEKQNIKSPFEYSVFETNGTEENKLEPVNFTDALENPSLPVYNIVFNPNNPDEIFFMQGNTLYLRSQKTSAIIEDLIDYLIFRNQIIWLSDSGHVSKSNLAGKNISALNETPLVLKEDGDYKITATGSFVFLNEDKSLFFFDSKTKGFEKLYDPIEGLKVSPNNDRILYFTNHEILFSNLSKLSEKNPVLKLAEDIDNCFWLNNDYLIFNINGEIKISEIDTRDKVNVIEIPSTISLADNTPFEMKDPEIYWDSTNKKLYIFDQNSLLVSEALTDRNNR